jgi:hypothetical protein
MCRSHFVVVILNDLCLRQFTLAVPSGVNLLRVHDARDPPMLVPTCHATLLETLVMHLWIHVQGCDLRTKRCFFCQLLVRDVEPVRLEHCQNNLRRPVATVNH